MNRIKLALPGADVRRARIFDEVLDSLYSSPKINTQANPPHFGVINLKWVSTTPIASGVTKLLHSFPHNYNTIPTVFGNFTYDDVSQSISGMLPFQLGSLGIITLDADEENINLKYDSGDISSTPIPAFTMDIKFYVMAEAGY